MWGSRAATRPLRCTAEAEPLSNKRAGWDSVSGGCRQSRKAAVFWHLRGAKGGPDGYFRADGLWPVRHHPVRPQATAWRKYGTSPEALQPAGFGRAAAATGGGRHRRSPARSHRSRRFSGGGSGQVAKAV